MPLPDLEQDGLGMEGSDFFGLGQDSYTQPLKLDNGEFVQGMNIMVRGGVAQTRPGSRTLFTMPAGNLQGSTLFRPADGIYQIVFVVSGLVYTSAYPFRTFRQLPNLAFSATSKQIAWASCLKSTDYTSDGILFFIDNPYSVLVMQDGNTRAGYWDGTNSGHLNPTKSGLYTSGATGLSITTTPDITVDPSTLSANYGTNVSLSVQNLQGTTYQWSKNGVAIAGETNPTLTLSVIDSTDAGSYRVVATNGDISYTAGPAVLTLAATTGTAVGYDETPVGLWMAWSNNRLWVSRGNQIFASDIGNPLKFTEAQYLNEGRAFYLPGDCTGIIETPDQQGVLCFTDSVGVFLESSIQDRTLWLSTPGFQKTILPNIGCVSGRSLVHQYGMIWWYSSRGLINLNSALQLNITSRIDIQDNEMFSTKYNMSYDLSGVASSFYENLVFISVPNGDKYNTQTMVLDQAPFEGNQNAWCGFWSGWRPVEWARGSITGSERIFFSSIDYDGNNRMWELMTPDKTDNGVPITCFVATRPHLMGNRDFKTFKYAEVELQEISELTSVMIAVAGLRGAYQRMGTKDIIATIGQVYAASLYGYRANTIAGSRPQTRLIRTQEGAEPSDCNSACVESDERGLDDQAFSLLIMWSGIAGVRCYRIFTRETPNTYQGRCEVNETDDALLTSQGCGVDGVFSTSTPFETFTSTKTYQATDPITFLPVSYTAIQTSIISQEDADNKATIASQNYVQALIGQM